MGEVTKLKPSASVITRHFVRVTRADHHGFTEFQYAIGDPNLYLEMTLPPAAFAEFCARHAVTHLTPAQAASVDAAAGRWHTGDEHEDEVRVD
jgi:phenol/toluene 2-monooxygenase (NADH) P0/A0